ncbi:MAG: aspartate kinase [Candidatus Bathyarchaeia archaeon]
MNKRVVIKFGGADLSSGEKIKKAAEMVLGSGYEEVVVVVSAIADTTNNLVKIMSQIGGLSDQDYAEIVSMGERTSARIFCSALRSIGAEAIYLEPNHNEWPIITDSNFKDAKPDMEKTCERVNRYIEPLLGKKIVVVCGFLGRDSEGNITTLGRGGSDTTAMILANCLKANEVILVKETEGVMSADPKVVPDAKPLEKLNIHEMFALAHGGAKIVKAEALKYKLPEQKLRIVSFSSNLNSHGTEIVGDFDPNSFEINEKKGILAISLVANINSENMNKLFASLGNNPIFGISTGKGSLTVFTSAENPNELVNRLHGLNISKALSFRNNVGHIEVTHPVFIDSPGWIAKISGVLASRNINIIEITTSKATINIFIDESKLEDAVKVVRDVLET